MAGSGSATGLRLRLFQPAGRRAGRHRSLTASRSRWWDKRRDRSSWSASLPARLRGLLDRLANADIGPAAADVAGHRVVDIGIGRTRIAREQRRSRHDLARLAIPALRDLAVDPGLLDLGAGRARADRLDRRDRRAADAVDRRDAGPDGEAVDVHGTGAAERHAAAELGAGHAEHVAHDPEERRVAVDIDAVRAAVDFDVEGHGVFSFFPDERGRPGSDQIDGDVDVAAGGFGIRTNLMSFIQQGLSDVARDAGHADVEASTEEVAAFAQIQVDLGVDGDLGRQRDLLLAGHKADRTFETGRPTGGEQLLRIGADARRAGGRKPDVQAPVGAARRAVLPPTAGVGLGRVHDLSGAGRGAFSGGLAHGALLIPVRCLFAPQRARMQIVQLAATSTTAWAKACGASCGRLWAMPPVMSRCSYLPENFLA